MYQGLRSTPPFCSAAVLGTVCSRMASCRWPLLTSTERLKTEYGSPAIVVTLPPASLTSRAPADTSQGLSLYSQNASATPAGNVGQCWRSIAQLLTSRMVQHTYHQAWERSGGCRHCLLFKQLSQAVVHWSSKIDACHELAATQVDGG